MNSSWPMKSYNAQRIGRSPINTADTPSVIKWRFSSGCVEAGAAINNDGIIYLGSRDFHVYALYPNGTMLWRYGTGSEIYSDPAIAADGTIYITSTDSYVYALHPDGTLKWIFGTGEIISSSPVISPNGTIYVGNSQGRVFALNPNGTELWHYDFTQDIYGSPALGFDGTIYFGSWDNRLYALNPNGTLKWFFPTDNHVKGIPSVAPDGTIYFGSWDGYLYALYSNGTLRWRCHVGSGTETTPALAEDGTIYVGGDDLYAVYPNGTMRWAFSLGSNHYIFKSCPAVSSDGTIYVGVDIGDGAGGEMLAVNPDGTERWRQTIATYWVESSPAIATDGTVYIGCVYNIYGGYLYAFGRGPLNIDANGPYTGAQGTPLQFTPTIYGGIPLYTYHWDFGDGHTANTEQPLYTYTERGNYTATFTVIDSEGNQSTDTANITIDYPLPTVTITRPINGLYFLDLRIFPASQPYIIGKITVKVEADQQPYGIQRVEFWLNSNFIVSDTTPPYSWTWRAYAFPGKADIKAIAYDTQGRSTKTSINIMKIF